MPGLRRTVGILVAVAVLALGLLTAAANFYTDWLWFNGTGFTSVFLTILTTEWAMRLVVGAIFFVFLWLNLMMTRRSVGLALDRFEGTPLANLATAGRVTFLYTLVSLVIAVFASGAASVYWQTVQNFLHGGAFGVSDPLFHHDIGFYVFKLPFYLYLYRTGMSLLVLTLLAVGVMYFLTGGFALEGFTIVLRGRAKFHLATLVALIFALKAWGYWLATFNLLYSTRGVVFGAGYTDVFVNLTGYKILAVIALACALIVMLATVTRSVRFLVAGVFLLVAASFLLGGVYPSVVQKFVVEPNELVKETRFIKYNIKSTRTAYGLDKIEEKRFDVADDLTYDQLLAEKDTLNNVRLWDWRPLEATYGQLQAMRLYYDFVNVDVDRYKVGGAVRAVTLSARELNQEKVPATARTWINLHFKYTHGYGVVMSPVNEITPEGMPNLWIKNIPPQAPPELAVKRPEIYYGELTDDYVIVDTKSKEFDYPLGDSNAYTTYSGGGGVQLKSPITRVAFAMRFGTMSLLLSNDITADSRVLMYRNIHDRVRRIAPFLRYDRDPYIVVNEGRLFWIQDAYVTSDLYPYSEPYGDWGNYARNSIKVVTDAYTGKVDFYLWDETEPLAQTYKRIFPKLFKPKAEMPQGLVAHVRYPEDLFRLQSDVFNTYHMEDPIVFYNKEDLWNIPREIVGNEEVDVEPYYVTMRLPDVKSAEFVLMQPLTPAKKNNMIAWLAAKSDPDQLGRLVVYKFPKQALTYGPSQVEARIDQDSEISRQLTLWNQKGSRVIRGNLLVIPVRKSILYVEPIYLQSEQSQMPELKRVVAAFGNHVVMETTLDAALARLFGVEVSQGLPTPTGPVETTPPSGTTATREELIRRANEQFTAAERRLQNGDWAGFGSQMDTLQETLRQLGQSR